MRKILLASWLALCATVAFAAVDVNKADQGELESVKGIGPGLSTRLLDERQKAPFKDWSDLIDRIKGVGDGNAQRFSDAGLTVNGSSYGAAPKAAAAAQTTKVHQRKAP